MTIDKIKKLLKMNLTIFPIEIGKKIGDPQKHQWCQRPMQKWNELFPVNMTEEYIEKKFKGKDVNIAAVCGREIGKGKNLIVVDVDVEGETHKNIDGEKWLGILFIGEEEILKNTYSQTTPSGGTHYFFWTDKEIKKTSLFFKDEVITKKGDITGIDILGSGSNVTMAPSTTQIGDYISNGGEILQLPKSVEDILIKKVETKKQKIDIIYLNPDKQLLINCLKKAAEDGIFDERTEWVKLAAALKDGGYNIDDFRQLSIRDDLTEKEVEGVWNSVDVNNKLITQRSLIFWAKQYGWTSKEKIKNKPHNGRMLIKNNYRYKTIILKNGKIEEKELESNYKTFYAEDSDFIIPKENYFSYKMMEGKKILIDKKNNDVFVVNTIEFFTSLARNKYDLDFKHGTPLTESKYFDFMKGEVDWIDRVSTTEEIGIQDDIHTLFIGKNIKPENNGSFRKWMDIFTDSDVRSSYRRASGVLSSFLGRSYDGKKPLFCIFSIGPGSGKTTGIQDIVILIEAEEAESYGISVERATMLNGMKAFSKKNIIIDNITKEDMKGKEFSKLTIDVTSNSLKTWIMNETHGSIKNNKTFWATLNQDVSLTNDLMMRSIIVEMKSAACVTNSEKLQYMKEAHNAVNNRNSIMADIMYIISQSEVVNNNTFRPHDRFVDWSVTMNNMLKIAYPEINEFDFGLNKKEKEQDFHIQNFIEDLSIIWTVRTNSNKKQKGFVSTENIKKVLQRRDGANSFNKSSNSVNKYIISAANKVTDEYKIEKAVIKINNKRESGFKITGLNGQRDHKFSENDNLLKTYINSLKDFNSDLIISEHEHVEHDDNNIPTDIFNKITR